MSETIWNLFFFIIVIGVLVSIHELGHFLVARWCGVKVYRFSIGFGPVLFSHIGKDGTEYALSIIPLGGYVKMKGEPEDPLQQHRQDVENSSDQKNQQSLMQQTSRVKAEQSGRTSELQDSKTTSPETQNSSHVIAQSDFAEFRSGYENSSTSDVSTDFASMLAADAKHDEEENTAGNSDSFIEQPCWKRFLILFAGPFSNIVLAFLLFVFCNLIGVSVFKPVVGDILPNSMAAQAGIHSFDLVQKVGEQEVYDWNEIMTEFIAHASEPITLTVSADRGTKPSREIQLDFTQNDFSPDVSPFEFLGFNPYYGKISHALVMVMEDGAAFRGGIQKGDRIFAVDGQLTVNWTSIQHYIDQQENISRALNFTILRKKGTPLANVNAPVPVSVETALVNGQEFTVTELFAYLKRNYPRTTLTLELQNLNPQDFEILNIAVTPEVVVDDKTGKQTLRIGIGTDIEEDPSLENIRQYGLIDSLNLAAHSTARMSVVVLTALKKLVVGDISARNVSGPIAIAKGAGMSASFGLVPFLWFLAAISINLGVFNLLPLPILDGGQIVYVLYEAITKRRPNVRMQNMLTLISLSLLLSLMMFSIFNDLSFF